MKLLVLICATLALAAGPATKPTTKPAKPFSSAAEVVQVVPPAMYPRRAEEWTDLRIDAVNRVLREKAIGHAAAGFRVRVVTIEPWNPPEGMYQHTLRMCIYYPPIGQTPVLFYGYFQPDRGDKLVTLKPGDIIAVNGTISRADFSRTDGLGVPLVIDLLNCDFSPARVGH